MLIDELDVDPDPDGMFDQTTETSFFSNERAMYAQANEDRNRKKRRKSAVDKYPKKTKNKKRKTERIRRHIPSSSSSSSDESSFGEDNV